MFSAPLGFSKNSRDNIVCQKHTWSVSIPTFHRTHESQLVWRITVYKCETPSRTSSQTRSRMRRQIDRRRTNRTHRVGALPQSHPGLCGTLAAPGKDTPPYISASTEGGRGWPKTRFTRHHQNDKTKVTAPRLGYQCGSGAGLLKPQIYEAATKLGDKNSARVHRRSRKDHTESLHPDSEADADCRGTESAI